MAQVNETPELEFLLRDIPDIPPDVKEKPWIRDDKEYPSYKDFVNTAEADKVYDFYADYIIEGEPHTFFMARVTGKEFVERYREYADDLEKKIAHLATEYEAEWGYVPSFSLSYIWRAIRPIK